MKKLAYFTFTVENTEITFYYQENMILKNRWSGSSLHMHPLHELFVLIDGSATIYGDTESVALSKNDVCILPPRYMHIVTPEEENPRRVALWFTYRKIRQSNSDFDFYALIQALSSQNIPLRFHAGKTMVYMLTDILSTTSGNRLTNINEIRLRNLFSLLFIQLTECLPAPCEGGEEQYPKGRDYYLRLVQIDQMLFDWMCRNRIVEDMAKELFLSPRQLSNIFCNEFGMSMKTYSYTLRIHHAAHLLTRTDMAIAEIAESVGYGSSEIFSIMFRRYFGMTASEYRKMKRQELT